MKLLRLVPLLAALPSLATENWPQFRGPDGQGVTERTGPTRWGPDEGVAWRTEVPGEGWSSPVIGDGKLVITTAEPSGGGTRLKARAYHLDTGKPAWERTLFEPTGAETGAKHAKNSLASATPVIEDGVVYVHFGHMGTAALSLADGDELWSRKVSYKPMHGNGSSPVVVGDKLVFNADAEEDPAVYALDRKDGSIAWRTPRNEEVKRSFSFSTPLVLENGGRTEIISPGSGMVGAYAPEDGKLLWKVSYDEGFSVVPRPVASGGRVFVATGFMRPQLLAIRLRGAKGDITESHVEWTAKRGIPKSPSIIATADRVIAHDDTGLITGFDAATGRTVWRQKLIGNFSASPLLAGEVLYCLTEDGVCWVVKVAPDKAEVVSEIDMGDRLFASPALVDGALYLRSEKALWKITGK